jgi:hypothetical protein
MRVVCILTVWNEIEYLPLKVEYCRQNKLEPYFIDNMSDDGTWEWLQENNIPSHRIDTDNSFDLRALQDDIVKTLHRLKPDWAIYNGCDLFPVTLNPLHDELEKLDRQGFNLAWIECVNFFNTGEVIDNFDPFNTYFYYGTVNRFKMIHKYNPQMRYLADDVSFPGQRTGNINGIMINYGNTKTKEERAETLKRRRKAWDNGEPRGHGTHYLEGERNEWVWDKTKLNDVRNSKYYPFVNKLQEVSNVVYGESKIN